MALRLAKGKLLRFVAPAMRTGCFLGSDERDGLHDARIDD
jgi:hypothetical protein